MNPKREECACKSGIRGKNCCDYHPKEEREDMSKKLEDAALNVSVFAFYKLKEDGISKEDKKMWKDIKLVSDEFTKLYQKMRVRT